MKHLHASLLCLKADIFHSQVVCRTQKNFRSTAQDPFRKHGLALVICQPTVIT